MKSGSKASRCDVSRRLCARPTRRGSTLCPRPLACSPSRSACRAISATTSSSSTPRWATTTPSIAGAATQARRRKTGRLRSGEVETAMNDNKSATPGTPRPPGRIGELVLYFLRLGLLGFGGPVALVGQMERELVSDKRLLTKDEKCEAIAICQSLPGPLAIQVGIYISYMRAGFWGAWAGGWSFILPNFIIVAGLGALYVHLGDLKPVTAIFYGVSPAVIALILHSCWRLAKLGLEDWLQWAIAAVCFVVTIALQAEVAFLFLGAGLIGMFWYGTIGRRPPALSVFAVPVLAQQLAPVASASTLG